jgi:transposase
MLKPAQCPRCQYKDVIGYGSVKGKQRWQCKGCQYRFTRLSLQGKPAALKALAVALYGFGLSFNAIGFLFSVSGEAVRQWVRQFSKKMPALEDVDSQEAQVLEMDEMHHFLQKKGIFVGSGKPLLILSENWLEYESATVIRLR